MIKRHMPRSLRGSILVYPALARAGGYMLFVTPEEAVFAGRDGSVERLKWVGANSKMQIELLVKQPGSSNYFIGNDPSKWRTNIPNYGEWP